MCRFADGTPEITGRRCVVRVDSSRHFPGISLKEMCRMCQARTPALIPVRLSALSGRACRLGCGAGTRNRPGTSRQVQIGRPGAFGTKVWTDGTWRSVTTGCRTRVGA